MTRTKHCIKFTPMYLPRFGNGREQSENLTHAEETLIYGIYMLWILCFCVIWYALDMWPTNIIIAHPLMVGPLWPLQLTLTVWFFSLFTVGAHVVPYRLIRLTGIARWLWLVQFRENGFIEYGNFKLFFQWFTSKKYWKLSLPYISLFLALFYDDY